MTDALFQRSSCKLHLEHLLFVSVLLLSFQFLLSSPILLDLFSLLRLIFGFGLLIEL